MNSDLLVISNNPLVWERADRFCEQIWGSALDVFYSCLKTLGAGSHILYAHPVAGNARLLHNPFRTIVLEKRESPLLPTVRSDIRLIEHFTKTLEELNGNVPEATRDDYRLIDFDLFLSAIPATRT